MVYLPTYVGKYTILRGVFQITGLVRYVYMMFLYDVYMYTNTYFSYGILDLSSVGFLDLTCWKMTLGPLRRNKEHKDPDPFFSTKLFVWFHGM